MSILTGYTKVKNRILTSEGFKLLSRWTSSNSLEFNDGSTAETKVGAINGISSSSTATAANIASSIGFVNQSFGTKLGGCSFKIEGDGAYVTYTPAGGADSVSKKLGSGNTEKKEIVAGTTQYTFDRTPIGWSLVGEEATRYYSDEYSYQTKQWMFSYVSKSNPSGDRYINIGSRGWCSLSGNTITTPNLTKGYIIAIFE